MTPTLTRRFSGVWPFESLEPLDLELCELEPFELEPLLRLTATAMNFSDA
jgi:hypothetical protein